MKLIPLVVVGLLLFVVGTVQADNIFAELVPDHAGISLQINLNADLQLDAAVHPMGCWELADRVEADLWNISPPGGGFSYRVSGAENERFLGVGYDGNLGAAAWYNRIVIYGKTPIEIPF